MSFKPQRVSAALTSGVNPAASGGVGRSSSLAQTRAPVPLGDGGCQNGKFNLRAPAEEIAKALGAGWLELWYQPKIGSQTLERRGAEALIRMRHPELGIVQPAGFILQMGEQLLPALSQFVIAQAAADRRYFLAAQRPLDLAINLPIPFLDDPAAFDYLCRQLPDHPAFEGLILEVDGSEITRDVSAARHFAEQARLRKLAISVAWAGSGARFCSCGIFRSSNSRSRRSWSPVVRRIVPSGRFAAIPFVIAANQFGARTVVLGIENHADFVTARELGFDLIQGFVFAKPMGAQSFARTIGAI